MNATIGNFAIIPKELKLTTNNQEFQSIFFQRFFDFCDCKAKTIENYKTFLKNFVLSIQENNIQNPTRQDIKAYKRYLLESNLSIGTKQQYFQSVKLFFKWLSCEGLYSNIAEGFKSFKVNTTETQKEAFTEEELQKIISSIDTSTNQGKRNLAMILLTITGGLRIIELQRANIGDIQERNRQKVLFIQGKGKDSKDDYIKIIPEVEKAINDYLQTRKDLKNSDPLFVGTSNRALNQRITETSLSRLFKTIFKDCGFNSSRLTAHSLRHSSNTLLFNSGADIYKVQNTQGTVKFKRLKDIFTHSTEKKTLQNKTFSIKFTINNQRLMMLYQNWMNYLQKKKFRLGTKNNFEEIYTFKTIIHSLFII